MDFNLNDLRINTSKETYRNLSYAELVAHAIRNGEGTLADSGALVEKTGKYTGRSPKDRFIVKHESINNLINWGAVNLPIEEEIFNNL
ncbi:MAG TPA: phosphoenolpyruvate carboxykinase (ATP), partial [Clostridium sp.]|nr:phosphoenolpyruvate carboxykinase (ATP) [Clostridium sp.]